MKPEKLKLAVKMSEITLDAWGLDNLASEYYGVINAAAGPVNDSNEQVVEFMDLIHPEFKTEIKANDCLNGLMNALTSFQKKSV